MPKIVINNVNLGGIAKSPWQGVANSVAQLVGIDLHSEPGIMKVNQKLTKESGSTIDDFVKKILPCSDGNTYLFGSTNGKIWKRTSAGVYSLEATASPGAGSAGIKDAIEDQGYIYYFMQSRVGRVAVGAPTAWAGRNDSWATFTNTDADFHPVIKVNLVNYIGDGKYIAQIEDGTFTANALNIKSPLRAKSLGIYDTELLVGSYVADNINIVEVFRWNTWSVSFSNSDPIPEKGINAFLKTDNFVLVSAGEKGCLYIYNGQQLASPKRINGDWGVGKKATVHSDATANFNNLPLFGVSNVASNPCLQGIYSLGNYDADYAAVLNLEYVISQAKLASIEIGSILVLDDYLLVSWKDGTTYGVDKLDNTAKYDSAYIETRNIQPDRGNLSKVGKIKVYYRTIPTGTSIEIWKASNYGAYDVAAMATKIDTKRKYVETTIDITDIVNLQIKVKPIVSANLAPEIEGIEINV
jgi:hypothetical protein